MSTISESSSSSPSPSTSSSASASASASAPPLPLASSNHTSMSSPLTSPSSHLSFIRPSSPNSTLPLPYLLHYDTEDDLINHSFTTPIIHDDITASTTSPSPSTLLIHAAHSPSPSVAIITSPHLSTSSLDPLTTLFTSHGYIPPPGHAYATSHAWIWRGIPFIDVERRSLLEAVIQAAATYPSLRSLTLTGDKTLLSRKTHQWIEDLARGKKKSEIDIWINQCLQKAASLTNIDIQLGLTGVELADGVAKNKTLTSLGLSRNIINYPGCVALTRALCTHPSIRSVDFSQNTLYAVCAPSLAKMIQINHHITDLNLSVNKLGPDGLAHLCPALASNTTLLSLQLSNNKFGPSIEPLTTALTHHPTLRHLSLALNDIVDIGAQHVARMIMHNTKLESLVLSDNCIGPLGCKEIMNALEHNHSLTSLELAWNGVGTISEGPKSIAKMLSVNRTLQSLGLCDNSLNEHGLALLIGGMLSPQQFPTSPKTPLQMSHFTSHPSTSKSKTPHRSPVITPPRSVTPAPTESTVQRSTSLSSTQSSLSLSSSLSTSSTSSTSSSSGLPSPTTSTSSLTHLNLSINAFEDAGVTELCRLLSSSSCHLRWLDISRCSIHDTGADALATALSHNHSLQKLVLSENAITKNGASQLVSIFEHHPTLVEMELVDPSTTKDATLALAYRRARCNQMARVISQHTHLLPVLARVCAHFLVGHDTPNSAVVEAEEDADTTQENI